MSFEKDITEIKKLIEKGYQADVETAPTEAPPVITPALPTQKPEKPRTPIKKTPGINPKPKAALTPDAELFLRRRNLLGTEAPVTEAKLDKKYDISAVPASKLKWIQTGDETLNKILPGLPQEQQDYLIKINSDSYSELVDRVEEFTGITVTPQNLPKLIGIVMQAFKEVATVESRNQRMLEDLALELVFSVPEFKVVEQAYLNDEISIDAKIGPADLTRLTQPDNEEEQAELDGLSDEEEANLAMAEFLENASDEDIRRRFSNLMISGGAIGKLYLYNMVADKLKRVDPKLPSLYGILSTFVHLGYWIADDGIEMTVASKESLQAGSEEVVPQGDKYIIKARGIIFPYLVHELVKGIYEYLALDPNQQVAMRKDRVEHETRDFMAGPGIHKTVLSYIPDDKQELIPMVQSKLTAMAPADIKDVLSKNQRGQQIMADLIRQAEDEWNNYNKSKEEYKDSF